MDTDDLEPLHTKEKPGAKKVNLDEMSIEAIGAYIADLEAEINRAKSAVKDKEQARNGAESLFKN